MIWTAQPGKARRSPLPMLFDFNVSQVWLTNNYLVFGVDAEYEFGSHAEKLAFWNLETGNLIVTPSVYWDSDEWGRSVKKKLFGILSSWRKANVAESEGRITVQSRTECLQVWPERREYASCSATH